MTNAETTNGPDNDKAPRCESEGFGVRQGGTLDHAQYATDGGAISSEASSASSSPSPSDQVASQASAKGLDPQVVEERALPSSLGVSKEMRYAGVDVLTGWDGEVPSIGDMVDQIFTAMYQRAVEEKDRASNVAWKTHAQ